MFVATHPDTAGFIRVSTWDLNANFLAQFNPFTSGTPEMSLWPVDIACDNHRVSTSYVCRLYFNNHSEESFSQASFVKTGLLWLLNSSGGMFWFGGTYTSHLAPMVSDATTYGRNASLFTTDAYFVTTDRFVSNSSSFEARMFMDTDGAMDPANIDNGTFDTPSGWSNVTSWDWNETIQRFVVVRLADGF